MIVTIILFWRKKTIQGRELFSEVRYTCSFELINFDLKWPNLLEEEYSTKNIFCIYNMRK